MNALLYAAAFTCLALGVGHSLLGETYLLQPLLRRVELSDSHARTLRMAWHLTSIAWFGFAALFMLMVRALMTYREVALVVAVTFIGSAVFALAVSRGRHPAWPLFGFAGGVAYALAYG